MSYIPFSFRVLRFLGHQTWIRQGLRYRIIRYLINPNKKNHIDFSVPFFNSKYTGNTKQYIDWWVFFFGAYELEDLKMVVKISHLLEFSFKRKLVVYDIGANTGHHSLCFSSFGRIVYAFEPYSIVRNILHERIKINNINNVQVIPYGLSNNSEILKFIEPGSTNTGTGHFINEKFSIDSFIELEVQKGDELVANSNMVLPDILKIDIEGYEPYALLGLKNTLMISRPTIIIELSSESFQSLLELGINKVQDILPENYTECFVKGNKLVKSDSPNEGKNHFFIPNEILHSLSGLI